MATQNKSTRCLFDEFEVVVNPTNNNNDKLQVDLLDEIDTELSHLFEDEINDIEFGGNTDGPIDFIKEIVEKVKSQFDDVVVDIDKKNFLSFFS